jgi:hypothetical protein
MITIWLQYDYNMIKYDYNMITIWLQYDYNMITLWLQYYYNMITIWLQYDYNIITIWFSPSFEKAFIQIKYFFFAIYKIMLPIDINILKLFYI